MNLVFCGIAFDARANPRELGDEEKLCAIVEDCGSLPGTFEKPILNKKLIVTIKERLSLTESRHSSTSFSDSFQNGAIVTAKAAIDAPWASFASTKKKTFEAGDVVFIRMREWASIGQDKYDVNLTLCQDKDPKLCPDFNGHQGFIALFNVSSDITIGKIKSMFGGRLSFSEE